MVPWLKTGFVVYTRLVLTWGFQVAIIECSSTKDVFLVDLFLGIKFKFIAKSCEDDGTQLKRIKFQNSLFSFSVEWVIEFLPKIFKKTVAILGNKVLENLKISKSVTNKS